MKLGIVVPYSWSFWGGVVEHADHQARALNRLGIETKTLIGYDRPGPLTRATHRRGARPEPPPSRVVPIGRSVQAPGNGSFAGIVLSPVAVLRLRRVLERERFDLLHLHEPILPVPCVAALALAPTPIVATFHAAGQLNWHRLAKPAFGFLLERIDHRLAVSEQARASACRFFPGEYEILPNGALVPPAPNGKAREQRVVFVGRHEPRKGLEILLRAWPAVHARTAARLRVVGVEPSAVRLLLARERLPEDGIDALGVLSEDQLTGELLAAKALAAPSLRGESFGMVLTRALACSTPAVASNIDGYRDVVTAETGILVRPGDPQALARALVSLLENEPYRQTLAIAGRRLVEQKYCWDAIARRLAEIYADVVARAGKRPEPVVGRGLRLAGARELRARRCV